MSIMRALWNGPFYVGKLTQPVSVGDVLLKFLEVIWRGLIAIVGLLAGGATAIAAYVYFIGPTFFPPIKDSISAKAFYAANLPEPPPVVRNAASLPSMDEIEREPCSKDFPIRVSVINNSGKPATDVRFELEGYAEGYSTNYVLYETGGLMSNRIIAPGRGFSGCYGVRTKEGVSADSLTYKVAVWSASEAQE